MEAYLKDNIESQLRSWKKSNNNKVPTYLVLDIDSYLILKTMLDLPAEEEVPIYAGFMLHILPTSETRIEFL